MVDIPTTQREYYNFQPKLNTFGTYATALYDIAKGSTQAYAQYKKEQETVKMNSLAVDTRVKMDAITNEWRVKNESDPFNPEALKDLQSQYNDLFNGAKEQLDPIVRADWDKVAINLRGSYDLSNQTWGFKQRQINTENAIKKSMSNYYSLAANYGMSGAYDQALADFATGYAQMLDDGARVLGTETAAQVLNDFEKNYALNFINGVAQSNPQQALNLLNNNKDIQKMLGGNTAIEAKGVVNSMIKQRNYDMKVAEFNSQLECMDAVDKAPTAVDKIKVLQEYEGNVSSKFYKAQMKALMRSAGITNETLEDTYAELFEKTLATYGDEFQAIKGRTDLLDEIEDAYGRGELKAKDRRALVKAVTAKRAKAFEGLDKVEDEKWTWGWDKGELIQKAKELFPNREDYAKAIYRYAEAIDDTDDADLSDNERKKIAEMVFKKVSEEKVNNAINQAKQELVGKKIGNFKIVGVR